MALRTVGLAAWLLLMANLFDASSFGWLAALLGLCAVGALVAPAGIPYLFFSDAHQPSNGRRWSEALGSLLLLGPALAVIISVIVLFGLSSMVEPFSLFLFVIIEVAGAGLAQTCGLQMHASGRPASGAALPTLLVLSRLCAAAVLSIFVGSGYWDIGDYLFLHAAGIVVACGVAYLWAQPIIQGPRMPRIPAAGTLRSSYSYMLMGGASVGTSDLDKPVIARVAGLDGAGVYSIPYRVLAALATPATALAAALLPRWSEAVARGDRSTLLRTFHIALGTALIVGLTTGGAVALLAVRIEPGQWGIYPEAWAVVPYLWPVVAALGMHQIAGTALIAIGRPGWRATVDVASLGLLIVGVYIGYDLGGLGGVALACVLVEALAALVMVAVFHNSCRLSLYHSRKTR